jgi:hypothetical protein
MPSAAPSFLLLPDFIERLRFVATKKMTLLSGNPDGLAFVSEAKSSTRRATD